MLLLEERSVKVIGSVVALGLAAAVLLTAAAAATMPLGALETAESMDEEPIDEKGEAEALGTAAVNNDNITPLPSETASGSDEEPVQQVKAQARPAQTKPAAGAQKPASGLSEGDIWLMAQLIHAEGRGESLEGQVAIGAVLLNRLRDRRFPNSLAGVIYEPGAFCTVRDGQINLTPNAKAVRAARLAAAGWDPTGGALYFYNPARSTSAWIFTRPVLTRIGRHVFAG
jgi:spore germination cell wall hydrolase CwlJ-like protein